MRKPQKKPNTLLLTVLILVAFFYGEFLFSIQLTSGSYKIEGILGALLGLFICSHPSANIVDMLFFHRISAQWAMSSRTSALWLAFNFLVLLVGWLVFVAGALRFVSS